MNCTLTLLPNVYWQCTSCTYWRWFLECIHFRCCGAQTPSVTIGSRNCVIPRSSATADYDDVLNRQREVFPNYYVCDVPVCTVSLACMLLQDFCTVLGKDRMKLMTPQRESVDITRHGALLHLTPDIVPYDSSMDAHAEELQQYMNSLDIDLNDVNMPSLPTGVDTVEQLKALISGLRLTYYHRRKFK